MTIANDNIKSTPKEQGVSDQRSSEAQHLESVVEDSKMPNLVIITGMSGAGRTEAIHVFEDMGYFCVYNLPAPLIADLVDLRAPDAQGDRKTYTAVVCDARNHIYFEKLTHIIAELDEKGVDYRIVFLDAADEKLVSRYKSSRRRHPLCDDGSSIGQGIVRERMLLSSVAKRADYIIDTTDMLPAQLHNRLRTLFGSEETRKTLSVSVYSFGFKHGAPTDADVVIDVRFLPNPYYDPELKNLTGLDDPVRKFVMDCPETELFKKRWFDLLDCVMPGYVSEGKQQLAIAVGCTGGQHRSVALAEATGDYLKTHGYRVSVAHRDLMKAETAASRRVKEDGGVDTLPHNR